VQSNAPLDACNHEGSTPLFLACRYARKDCIQELIAAGVRKEGSVETRYISALHSAAYNGNVECIEVLLEAKAQVQAKDIDDWTPLHYATRFNRIGAMELLIQAQADVNAMDTIGWTPGHTACRNGLGNALEILLRHNVDISVCSKSNETLMHIASRKVRI
jgi:ankyrin repeat protein